MKRTILGTIIIAAFILLLCACTKQPPTSTENSTAPSNTTASVPTETMQHSTDPTINSPSESTDPAEPLYGEILNEYQTLIEHRVQDSFKSDWTNGLYSEGLALKNAIPDENGLDLKWGYMLWDMTAGLDDVTTDSFGYTIKDINADGSPELLWIREDATLLAIFTICDDEVHLLDAFWPKHKGVVTKEGKLYSITSGGAAFNYYEIAGLSTEGCFVIEKEFGMNGGSAETGTLYYEVIDTEEISVPEERFDELLSVYPFEWGSDYTVISYFS